MIAYFLERAAERLKIRFVQVLKEVLPDSAPVHGPRSMQRLLAFRGDADVNHAPVVRHAHTPYEPHFFHAIDHARQATLTEQNPSRELGHPESVLTRLLEVDENVVPRKCEITLGLKFVIEDVDQGLRALQEDPPGGELFL